MAYMESSRFVARFMDFKFPIYQQPTLSSDELPPVLRAPYIHTGYRLPNQSWTYYVKSLFYLNNDSMNMWTHIVGSLVAMKLIWNTLQSENFQNDPKEWTMLGFIIGCFFIMFLSALAHTFHLRSIRLHHVLYMFDYGGVTLYDFGTGLGYSYISSHTLMHNTLEPVLLPINMFFSWFTFYTCCKSRLQQDRRTRVLKMAAAYSAYAFIISIPVLARYVDCLLTETCSFSSLNHLTLAFILMTLCMVTYGAHVPERLFPRRFDIIGHSHCLFHVVGMVTLVVQKRAFHVDMQSDRSPVGNPSLASILLAFAALILAQILTVASFRKDINRRIDEDTRHWENILAKRK